MAKLEAGRKAKADVSSASCDKRSRHPLVGTDRPPLTDTVESVEAIAAPLVNPTR